MIIELMPGITYETDRLGVKPGERVPLRPLVNRCPGPGTHGCGQQISNNRNFCLACLHELQAAAQGKE